MTVPRASSLMEASFASAAWAAAAFASASLRASFSAWRFLAASWLLCWEAASAERVRSRSCSFFRSRSVCVETSAASDPAWFLCSLAMDAFTTAISAVRWATYARSRVRYESESSEKDSSARASASDALWRSAGASSAAGPALACS